MNIRLAEPTEYAAIGELTVAVYANLPDGRLTDDYAAQLRAVAERAAAAEVVVAVDQRGLLGSVTFAADGPYAELADPEDAEFRMLVVDPRRQGHGIGEALVRYCIDRARELDRTTLVLSTTPWMRAAQRLYERLGFVRTPAKDWEPVPGITLLTYELSL